ncbi:hypothetical protein A1OE_1375 [Candidatus Endolissoclinum faulkneri L2]|uniref:Uncharacterized protein n=1 Tax=Candidatus Endolissoclinum faulkneri L2 TaxID=1193729 RepID=K7ZDI2_9PROT|nr:hypothetical protein A1OE_1375 [Candidatus Endolissoclinum faulkneri L2]
MFILFFFLRNAKFIYELKKHNVFFIMERSTYLLLPTKPRLIYSLAVVKLR